MNELIKKIWAGFSLQKYTGVVLCMLCSILFMATGCIKQNSELDEGEDQYEGVITSQQFVPYIKNVSLKDSEEDYLKLFMHLNKFTAFEMDPKTVADYLHDHGGSGQIRLQIGKDLDWTIDLEYMDMRAPEYGEKNATDEETPDLEAPYVAYTFRGKTSDGQNAWFIIDENKFFGMVLNDAHHYFIQPAHGWNSVLDDSDNRLIAYSSLDVQAPVVIQSGGYCARPISSFIENVSKYLKNDSVYVIKGIALDAYEYGRHIRLMEDLKGNFPENALEFIAWGDGFGIIESARFNDLSRDFEHGDVLILILTTYDHKLAYHWEFIEDWQGIPFFEKHGDYRTIGCTYSAVMKLSDNYLPGGMIFPWTDNEMKVHWHVFKEICKDIFNSKP